jgi:hypothetical protein
MITLSYTRLNKKSKFLKGIINKNEGTKSSIQNFVLNVSIGSHDFGSFVHRSLPLANLSRSRSELLN